MKKVFTLTLILVNLCQIANSQFKAVSGGFAYNATAIISATGYAEAGGGVILKGESKAILEDSHLIFQNVSITDDTTGFSNIEFKTSKCNVYLSSYTWLMRDAVMFVNGETKNEMHRDVNLLDTPSAKEVDTAFLYPTNEYFYIELNKDLIGTKSGEMLLLLDLLQTDVEFYSDTTASYSNILSYKTEFDTLLKKSLEDSHLKCLKYDSIRKTGTLTSLDSFRIPILQKLAVEYLYNKIAVTDVDYWFDLLLTTSNWTYNDEKTNYTFSCSCDNHQLVLRGNPQFTYLTSGFINTLFTNYLGKHPYIISNLKKETFSNTNKFAQVASFFRYLKNNNNPLWSQIVYHYKTIPKTPGNTPRIIKR
jgi:hypothetical protein